MVRTERPFYFSKTDATGNFKINNIKPDTFKVFALEDIDFNYLFNLENEVIGYLDDFIVLPDSTLQAPTITMYEETPKLNRAKTDTMRYGLVKLTYNQTTDDLQWETIPELENVFYKAENDSIKLWYNTEQQFDLILTTPDYQDTCLLYTSPSPRDQRGSRMPSSA